MHSNGVTVLQRIGIKEFRWTCCNMHLMVLRSLVVLIFLLCISTWKLLRRMDGIDIGTQGRPALDQPTWNDGVVDRVTADVNPHFVHGKNENETATHDPVDGRNHGDDRIATFEAYVNSRLQNLTLHKPTRVSFLETTATNRAVFYNIFVTKEFEQRTFRLIINNQVRGVQESPFGMAPLYYNLIGFNSTRFVCRSGMTCTRLRYLPEGNEVDTLQDMYDYCMERPDHVVAYIHDKGSFNFSPSNSRVRRLATKAALSSACYNISEGNKNNNKSTTCDVCSLNFNIKHHPHTSGNMFAAKCSYIKTLIPPKQFEIKRLQMVQGLLTNSSLLNQFSCLRECIFETMTDPDNRTMENAAQPEIWLDKMLSLGRYAYESWVYSSPMVEPCDVLSEPIGKFDTGGEAWQPELSKARFAPVLKVFGIGKLDFLQGYGKLFEYQTLYGVAPGRGNWFWRAWQNYHQPSQHTTCPC